MWKTFDNSGIEYKSTVTSYDHSITPPRPIYTLVIKGADGTVSADCIVWVKDDLEYITLVYDEIIRTLNGEYHCCLTGNTAWF